MKKKIILATVIGAFGLFALAGCSTDKDVVTMKGGKITTEDYYNEIKKSEASQQALVSMIINDVFINKYGDKVDQKAIDTKYKEYEKSYKEGGQDFKEVLKTSGFTEDSFKNDFLKGQLAMQAGFKSHLKIKDEDLKEAWKTYHPEVSAQIIQAESEDAAKEIKKQLDEGGDFSKIAKEKSKDTTTKEKGGEVKFDSTNTTVPDEVKTVAYELKDGQVSDVITVNTTDSTYGTTTISYYLVKMTKNKSKGNDWKPYKKELTKIVETQKVSDQTFQLEVIGKELDAANVQIKDDTFKGLLDQYLPKKETKDSKTKESSSKSKESKESTDKSADSSEASTSSSEATEETSSK